MELDQNDRLRLYAYLLPPPLPKNIKKSVSKRNKFTTVLENKNGWNWWTAILRISRSKEEWRNYTWWGKPQPRSHGGTINCKGGSNSGTLRAQTRQQVGVLRKVSQEPAGERPRTPALPPCTTPPPRAAAAALPTPWPRHHTRTAGWRRTWTAIARKNSKSPFPEEERMNTTPRQHTPAPPTQQRRWILIRVFTEKQRISDIKMSTHKNYQIFQENQPLRPGTELNEGNLKHLKK